MGSVCGISDGEALGSLSAAGNGAVVWVVVRSSGLGCVVDAGVLYLSFGS